MLLEIRRPRNQDLWGLEFETSGVSVFFFGGGVRGGGGRFREQGEVITQSSGR